MKTITILVPAYNEEEVLPAFKQALTPITNELNQYQFEFLFINDGSSDGTAELLHQYSLEDPRVEYIELSRNFGKRNSNVSWIRLCAWRCSHYYGRRFTAPA